MSNKFALVLAIYMSLFIVIVTSAQSSDDIVETQIYICIGDDTGIHLLELIVTEPVGLIFAKETSVIIYSNADKPLQAEVTHIEHDVELGTYESTESIATANTTSNIPSQSRCDEDFSDTVLELERTILLRVLSNHAVQIRHMRPVPDETPPQPPARPSRVIGSIGMLPTNTVNGQLPFPAFQLLRYSGGRNDQVSIKFSTLQGVNGETDFYVISRRVISFNETNLNGDTSIAKNMEPRSFFLAELERINVDFINDIMRAGTFRMFVDVGEIITYKDGYYLNLARLSTTRDRSFPNRATVIGIDGQPFTYYAFDNDSVTGSLTEATIVRNDPDMNLLIVQLEDGTPHLVLMEPWLVDIVE